ncbi:MAG: hypothetical protein GY750_05135 [Lentisphaerae bacterium]|nr:hypothetical protein [Lentisphaerota bacterium]MCP4100797.1 hypothetical protein [Lentisphaerota bacterium]
MTKKRGFDKDNLERHNNKNFGLYLHLHGSPLFYQENGCIKKSSLGDVYKNLQRPDTEHNHIVLTHKLYKQEVIDDSRLLKTYWDKIGFCLGESNELILLGYSGNDDHLNNILREYLLAYDNINCVNIIEWHNSEETENSRINFWEKKICKNIEYISLSNITDFTQWENPKSSSGYYKILK